METFYPRTFDSIWWAPENRVCSLVYFIILLTTEGLKMAHLALNLEKKTHRKETTHNGNRP